MIGGVGGDSGESEGQTVRLGDCSVERGFGNRGRYWPGGGRGGSPLELLTIRDTSKTRAGRNRKKKHFQILGFLNKVRRKGSE